MIVEKIKNYIRIKRWREQISNIPKNVKMQESFDQYNEILILIPHADDEFIGCYNLLQKYTKKITLLFFDLTGSNSDTTNRDIRKTEFVCYISKMKLNYKIIDCSYYEFESVICKNSYDLIMLPSIIDWHKEHRLMNEFLYRYLYKRELTTFDIAWYQISVPIAKVNLGISFNKKQERKMIFEFKKYYKSQANLKIERFILNRSICVPTNDCYRNEGFYKMNQYRFIKYYELLNENNFDFLKQYIDDLNMIWKESLEVYNLLENL